MVIATFFLIPELKDRTLEEVDQLFESGIALRKFKGVKTRTAEEMYEEEMHTKEVGSEKRMENVTTTV